MNKSQHYQRKEYKNIEEQLIYDWARREILDLGEHQAQQFIKDILDDLFSLSGLPIMGKHAKAVICEAWQDHQDYIGVFDIVNNKVTEQQVPNGYKGLDHYSTELKDVMSDVRRAIKEEKKNLIHVPRNN